MEKLNSSKFKKLKAHYLKNDFEYILTQIYNCYLMMLERYDFVENNENKIRNRLYRDYLKSPKIKFELGIGHYIFHPEIHEIDEEYNESARTDIMVYSPKEYLLNEKAYNIIECKRIDGNLTLNKAYINEGINRFVSGKYSLYKGINGMLGFVVTDIDVMNNVKKIPPLIPYYFIENFENSYISLHKLETSNLDFKLYHLMLNFSSKIKPI